MFPTSKRHGSVAALGKGRTLLPNRYPELYSSHPVMCTFLITEIPSYLPVHQGLIRPPCCLRPATITSVALVDPGEVFSPRQFVCHLFLLLKHLSANASQIHGDLPRLRGDRSPRIHGVPKPSFRTGCGATTLSLVGYVNGRDCRKKDCTGDAESC